MIVDTVRLVPHARTDIETGIVAITYYCVRFDASSHQTPVFVWTGASCADRRSALRMGAGKYSSHVHKDLARRSRALPLILSLRI
jgi:hypothetical protein